MKPVEIEFLVKNNTRQGLSGVSDGIDGVEKDAADARKQIEALEAEVARLRKTMSATPKMDHSDNIRQIETLQARIKELEADLDRVSKSAKTASDVAKNTTLVPPDAAKAKSTFNGLNMSIQQIAREMPSLAMGPQMFFLAISNNLPIFADEVTRARKEYELLTASGQKAVPVWRQILKSLFSWQTAMTTGIMLLIMYGKEIGSWISGLVQGKSALDDANRSATAFHATMLDGAKKAQEEITKLRLLYDAATDMARPYEERKRAVEKLQEAYPSYFGNMDSELIMAGRLEDTYDRLRKSIVELARARAASEALTKMEGEQILVTGAPSYRGYVAAFAEYVDAMTEMNSRRDEYRQGPMNDTEALDAARAAEKRFMEAAKVMKTAREKLLKEIQSFDGGSELVDRINDQFDGNIAAYIRSNNELRERLTEEATKTVTLTDLRRKDPDPKQPDGNQEKTILGQLDKLSDMELAARRRIEDQKVEIEYEGYERRRKQAELNFEREKQRIDDEERQRLALYGKLKSSGANVSEADRIGIQAQAATQRVQAAQLFDGQMTAIDKEEEEDNRTKLERMLAQYQDYAAKREAIERKYNTVIEELRSQLGGNLDDEINRAIDEAERVKQRELAAVNAQEAASAFKDNDFLRRLFGDYSSMSFNALQNLISQARQLKEYLSGNGSAEGITFISPEDLANIEKSPADLDRLRKALERLLNTGSRRGGNPWENIFNSFKEGIAQMKGAQGVKAITNALGAISGAASNAAGQLADFFASTGDTQTADTIAGVQQALGAVSNIAQGFAQGGLIGGIGATIGEAINFIGQGLAAEARHQEALKEIAKARLAFQRQYNLALLEQKLLMEDATNIFGEREIEKAINAVNVYRETYAKLQDEMTRLNQAEIVTGHKKTGLFGWGKGKDIYSSILAVYPQLIDANGELDTAMLQTILDTQKMSDETRAYLENLVDLKDMLEEAEEALEDYLQETFGALGDGILESITTVLREGGDALENFADDAAAVLERLGEQIAYSLFFADKFDDLQNQLKDVYGGDGSPEEIANEAMDVLDAFYDNIGSDMNAAQAWLEAWKEKAEEMGFDLWQNQGSSQRGQAGEIQSVSQESFSRVEGLATSMQIHLANIDDSVEEGIVPALSSALDDLHFIRSNTGALPLIYAMLQKFDRDGFKVR